MPQTDIATAGLSTGWAHRMTGLDSDAEDVVQETFLKARRAGFEGSDRMVVLFHVADRSVDRVRVLSEDCEHDAGGRAITWLEGVQAMFWLGQSENPRAVEFFAEILK